MLHVSIKDTKTNEVIYDEEVSLLIMLASEKDFIRTIRHMTDDASALDVVCLTEALTREASNVEVIHSQAFDQALGLINEPEVHQ